MFTKKCGYEELGNQAASHGQQDVIQWIIKQSSNNVNRNWNTGLCYHACSGGQANLLLWLMKNKYKYDFSSCVNTAIENGHLSILQILVKNPKSLTKCSYEKAASKGHIRILIWFYDKFGLQNYGESMMIAAAGSGQQLVIEWLLENEVKWSPKTIYYAASNGHLDLIKWAYSNGCPLNTNDANLCEVAAERLQLEVLKWLRSQNCFWSASTFCKAVYGKDEIEFYKWMKDNGCPWDDDVFSIAVNCCKFETLKWLKENGCPWNEDAYYVAIHENRDFEIIKWLKDNDCPWTKFICETAAIVGDLEILKWLRDNGCTWDSNMYNICVDYKDNLGNSNYNTDFEQRYKLLEYLLQNNSPLNDIRIFENFMKSGNSNIIALLLHHTLNKDSSMNQFFQNWINSKITL